MRLAPWGMVGVTAATVLILSAQPARSATTLHVSFAEATYGQLAPSTTVLAVGRPGQPVGTQVHIDGWVPGPTSVLVLVGRPGTSDDVEQDADLTANAVLRPDNQLVADTVTTGSVRTQLTAPVAGQYPVFLLLSGLEDACGSANMVDPPVQRSVTQIGVLTVRS